MIISIFILIAYLIFGFLLFFPIQWYDDDYSLNLKTRIGGWAAALLIAGFPLHFAALLWFGAQEEH